MIPFDRLYYIMCYAQYLVHDLYATLMKCFKLNMQRILSTNLLFNQLAHTANDCPRHIPVSHQPRIETCNRIRALPCPSKQHRHSEQKKLPHSDLIVRPLQHITCLFRVVHVQPRRRNWIYNSTLDSLRPLRWQ